MASKNMKNISCFQRHWLAVRITAGHCHRVHDIPVGNVLQIGLALSPTETGHPPSEEPKTKDQRQEPA